MIAAILHGLVLSVGLILPLGPQNAFVLAQGAAHGSIWRAMPVVVTAGLCDSLLILAAVLGVSVAVAEISWLRMVLVVVGVAFLAVVGWLTWRSPPVAPTAVPAGKSPARRQVAFALAVSLGNPHAILDTIGVIGTSSLAYGGTAKSAFAAACILVSWLWFVGLALAGRALSRIETARRLLNRFSAVVMWISAGYMASMLAP